MLYVFSIKSALSFFVSDKRILCCSMLSLLRIDFNIASPIFPIPIMPILFEIIPLPEDGFVEYIFITKG
jgi:hypothetical protein